MSVAVFTSFQRITDSSGNPCNGALINVYAANTTTPLALYSDSGLSVSVSNPITCDTGGQHAITYIATASYKVVATKADGTALAGWSKDNIDPGVAVGSGALPVANGGTAATTAATARTNLSAASQSDMTTAQTDITNLQAWTGRNLTTASQMASGTTAQQPVAGTAAKFRFNTTTGQPEVDNGAAWKKVGIEGKWDPQTFPTTGTGCYLLQRSITAVGTTQSITASIPADGTIPQSSEGTQITNWSVAFTPKNSASLIIVTVDIEGGSSATAATRVAALFRNSATDAVRSALNFQNAAAIGDFHMRMRYEESPGSISAITYSVRGGVSSGTFYINTDGNGATLGGATGGRESYLIIEEWYVP